MSTISPESVTIFNSPVLSAKVLSKIAYDLVVKGLNLAKTHLIVLSTVLVAGISIYFVPGPQKPVRFTQIVNLVEEILLFIG